MQLKGRLLAGIVVALVLQSVIAAGLGISTFVRQARHQARIDLQANLIAGRRQIERTRHRLYREVLYLRQLIEDLSDPADVARRLDRYASTAQADEIVVTGTSEVGLSASPAAGEKPRIEFLETVDHHAFRFPTSRFYVDDTGPIPRLYLVTGSRLRTQEPGSSGDGGFDAAGDGDPDAEGTGVFGSGAEDDAGATLFTVYEFDRGYLDRMLPDAEYGIAFLLDDRVVLTTFPAGRLGERLDPAAESIRIRGVTHRLESLPISARIPGVLRLTTLESTLAEQIYLRAILTSFLVGFLISVVAAAIVAVINTTHLLAPFRRLHDALAAYFEDGTIPNVPTDERPANDDVSYLVEGFQTLVQRLIHEQETVRRQLEEITYLHRYNEAFVAAMQAGVLVADEGNRIEYSNAYVRELFGARNGELHGRPLGELLSERFEIREEQQPVLEATVGVPKQIDGVTYRGEREPRRFVVKLSPIAAGGHPRRTLIVLEDVTRTEELWRRVFVAEKITSLGLLSAGMAHEINNPLEAISSHADYLLALDDDPERRESLEWIRSETTRISELIQRILSFARERVSDGTNADVVTVWEQAVELAGFELRRRRIEVCEAELLEADGTGRPVEAAIDPSELKQVFLNLILNAAQASDEGGHIGLRVRTETETVVIDVYDNGSGIAESELDRVFDPFYTSEFGGIGLGLPLSHVMVSHAGGSIRVQESGPGGTCFRIRLPRTRETSGPSQGHGDDI